MSGIVWLVLAVILVLGCATLIGYVRRTERYVHVVASGSASRPPDEASVTVGLRSENITQEQLPQRQTEDTEKFSAIVDAMQEAAPDASIETLSFSVTPNYNSETGEPTGYTIYNSSELKVKGAEKLVDLGDAVQAAIDAGSNSIGGVHYTLQEETKTKLALEAQQEALQVAKNKASDLASGVRESLGRPLQVVEQGSSQFNDFHRQSLVQSSRDGAIGASIAPEFRPPEKIDFTSTLQVRYELN